MKVYKPRNENVLIRIEQRGQSEGGVNLPQSSIMNKRFFVEAIGSKVENLEVGNEVMMAGELDRDYAYLPESTSLLIINQRGIVMIIEEKEDFSSEQSRSTGAGI